MHLQGGSAQTFVARVPRGRLEAAPMYWDGEGWTADATKAAPIVDNGRSTELRLGIAEADGHYVGVAIDGYFFGDHFAVLTAPAPQGPGPASPSSRCPPAKCGPLSRTTRGRTPCRSTDTSP